MAGLCLPMVCTLVACSVQFCMGARSTGIPGSCSGVAANGTRAIREEILVNRDRRESLNGIQLDKHDGGDYASWNLYPEFTVEAQSIRA